MTRIVNGKLIIEVTPPGECEMCNKIAELRPYGPHGENICFECGMKDEAAAIERFHGLMNGTLPKKKRREQT